MKQSSLTTGVVQGTMLTYQRDEGEATAEVGSAAWFRWLEQAVAQARAQLGEQAFRAAWAEGRLMTPQQTLDAQEKEMIHTALPTRSAASPLQPPRFPAGLTAREVEVLRLLAQGWTDAQIAEHLVISVRTVNNHTASLYSKLGVSSRAAATRAALEYHVL